MRFTIVVLACLAVLGTTSASAAAPTFTGSWSGTYAMTFDRFPCVIQGCLPDSPAYCERTDPTCHNHVPQTDFCPGFKIGGAMTARLTQTGKSLKGSFLLVGGVLHRGDQCSMPQRDDYPLRFTGTVSGATAKIASAWPTGALTVAPSGRTVTGTLASTTNGYTATLTVKLSRR
jgi:hypothetical protein